MYEVPGAHITWAGELPCIQLPGLQLKFLSRERLTLFGPWPSQEHGRDFACITFSFHSTVSVSQAQAYPLVHYRVARDDSIGLGVVLRRQLAVVPVNCLAKDYAQRPPSSSRSPTPFRLPSFDTIAWYSLV